jgi:hypothetical protein
MTSDSLTKLPSQDAVLYKTSAGYVWLYRFAFASCLGLAGAAVWLLITAPNPFQAGFGVVGTLFFVVFAAYLWGAQRRALNQIAVDESGIWRLPPNGSPLFIAWRDVGVVKSDDSMQRLIVSDQSRARTLWLEYQLDNYPVLRDYVLRRTAPGTRFKQTVGSVFHGSWALKVVMLVCSGLFVAVALAQHGWQAASLFLILIGLCLMVVVRDPLSLTIASDRIVIRYPGWKREIAFRNITSVTPDDTASAYGNPGYLVVIAVKGQKPLKLYRFREGSLAVCEALRGAL